MGSPADRQPQGAARHWHTLTTVPRLESDVLQLSCSWPDLKPLLSSAPPACHQVGEKRQAQEGGFRELRLKRLVI